MEVTEEDFSDEFLKRFANKEKQYIIDFCNTFQKTFPNILDKDTLLSKINKLGSLTFNDRLGKREITGETTYNSPVKIEILPNMSDRDERNSIYHELFHLISYKGFEKGLYEDGMMEYEDELYTEYNGFDEIMNEFYTIKMLENEGRVIDSEIELNTPTKSNLTRIVAPKKGNGYVDVEPLAEIYDRIFGKELLEAKLRDRKSFVEKFNKEFDGLNIRTRENQNIPAFAKLGIQLGEDKFGAGETALRIWKQKYIEKHGEDKFDLYEYLKESLETQKSLYRLETFNKIYRGDINYQTLPRYEKIFQEFDEEIVMQYLRPDLVGEQTKTDKIIQKKQFKAVINALRDNIDTLTADNIDKVTYGEILQYNHGNMSCLIIDAGDEKFMTFASEERYQGCAKFKELSKDYSKSILGDDRSVQCATVPTTRHKWSILKDEKGYIPLSDNPNMMYVELSDEVYLDGSSKIKEEKMETKSRTFVTQTDPEIKISNNYINYTEQEITDDGVKRVEKNKSPLLNSDKQVIGESEEIEVYDYNTSSTKRNRYETIEGEHGVFYIDTQTISKGEEFSVFTKMTINNEITGFKEESEYKSDGNGNEYYTYKENGIIGQKITKTARGITIDIFKDGQPYETFEYDEKGKAIIPMGKMEQIPKDFVENSFRVAIPEYTELSHQKEEPYVNECGEIIRPKTNANKLTQDLGRESWKEQKETMKKKEVAESIGQQKVIIRDEKDKNVQSLS